VVESQLRALFEELASGEPPPSRVDTGLARRQGRRRLRWRRAAIAGAPVLAAAAAAAVVLATGVAAPSVPARVRATPAAGRSSPPPGPAQAPSHFNPLVPYLSFGWLPAGQSLIAGGTGRTEMYVVAGPRPAKATWSLAVYSAGRCQLATAQLNCTTNASAGQTEQITGRAPAVDGHPAFWAGGYLVWRYARGGWAWLSVPPSGGAAARAETVKVASHVRYGAATTPSLVFPVQLTRVPGRWQVSSVYFRADAGGLRASQYSVSVGAAELSPGSGESAGSAPFFSTGPATSHNSCSYYPGGQSTREIIGGYRVTVNHLPGPAGASSGQQLCAADADGLAVFITEAGSHPAIGVTALFAHHLRLLGTNPANWTRAPID
jgi:hypothetical protein